MAEVQEQVMVGVREAAELARVSQKQIRKWITAGKVRAEMRDGKFGPTWFIEASSLPLTRRPMELGIPRVGQGVHPHGPMPEPADSRGGGADSRGGTGAVQALVAMLGDLQRRHEGAVARLGQLEGEREQRLALEAEARSLAEREALARAEADAQRQRAEELAQAEAQARAEAEQERKRVEEESARAARLASDVQTLQERVKWRTWVAAASLVAALGSLVTLVIRLATR